MGMPREAASSLPALGRGGGGGLLANEKSGRACATNRKRNAPLAPLARPGGQGGHFRFVVQVRTDSRSGADRGRRATKREARLARRTQATRLDREKACRKVVFRAVARFARGRQGDGGLATTRSGIRRLAPQARAPSHRQGARDAAVQAARGAQPQGSRGGTPCAGEAPLAPGRRPGGRRRRRRLNSSPRLRGDTSFRVPWTRHWPMARVGLG